MSIITTAEGIARYHFASQRAALKLETLGMRNSRGSVYALVKRQYGFKGTKAQVLAQMSAMLDNDEVPQSLVDAIKRSRGEA